MAGHSKIEHGWFTLEPAGGAFWVHFSNPNFRFCPRTRKRAIKLAKQHGIKIHFNKKRELEGRQVELPLITDAGGDGSLQERAVRVLRHFAHDGHRADSTPLDGFRIDFSTLAS
jgi:hypothetical protein